MSDAQEPWASTKALSVYNVLRLARRPIMPLGEVLDYLREHFDPKYPELWVGQGADQLVEWGFANALTGNVIAAAQLDAKGNARPLQRADFDASLQYV